jgi:hypothetical protein
VSGPLRLVWLLLAIVLFGADTSPFPPPVVIVYPLTTTGGTAPEAGDNIAVILSSKMIALGGITVKPYTPGTARSDYLVAATKADADYYVTGFLTPVGDDVSLILQVVSIHSGSVVFSNTAMIRTYSDALAQADVLRSAILRHAGRSFAAIDEPPPAPATTPEPSGQGVNLTRAFHHREREPGASVAGGSPSPAASSQPARIAARGAVPVLVFAVGGPADSSARTYAAGAIVRALARDGISGGILPVTADQSLANTSAICAANGNPRQLYGAALALTSNPTGEVSSVQLDLAAYDCTGAVLARKSVQAAVRKRGGVNAAIDAAALQGALTLPKPAAAAPA